MSSEAKKQAVDAAISVAEDITAGRLEPAEFEQLVVVEVRRVAGVVVGPPDLLWPVQVQICRDVLAVGGGVPAHELAEWAAVTALKEGVTLDAQKSWMEQLFEQYDDHKQQEEPDG